MISESVAKSALGRRESRGAHSRIDYMEKDEHLGTVNTVTRLAKDGSLTTELVPVLGKTPELESLVKEMG
jgi:succinate dehydrogenase / fumarate reductase flavoprotein subunit